MDNILKVSSNFDWILEITFLLVAIFVAYSLISSTERLFAKDNLAQTAGNAGLALVSFAIALRLFVLSDQDQFSKVGIERLIVVKDSLAVVGGILIALAVLIYLWNKWFPGKS